MKKLLKPYCIVFYFLMFLVFFLAGLSFASVIDAGKNQGLAGGAIVLGWGVLFGGIAFIVAVFTGFRIRPKILVKLNWVLLIVLLIAYGIAHFRYDSIKDGEKPLQEIPAKPTSPVDNTTAMITDEIPGNISDNPKQQIRTSMGLGFFIPDFYKRQVLHFYGDLNPDKPVDKGWSKWKEKGKLLILH